MKQQKKRGLVDLSSVIWTSLLAGKDTEFGKAAINDSGKEVWVNSAAWGYENAINHLTSVMEDLGLAPRDLILVKEGQNSKMLRQSMHPLYKSGRDRTPEQYEQFNLCREQVIEVLLNLGAQMCWQDGGVESDDVLGFLATNLQGEIWVITADKDLAQLVGDNVHLLRTVNGVKQYDPNPFGEFPHRLIPVYISLVGDSGDKIPGAKGFGDKAFQMVHLAFGDRGLELMQGLIENRQLKRLEEDVGDVRELQKILDDQDGVYMSYQLGRLQIDKVNTLNRPLQWRAGMVKPRALIEDERLRKFGTSVKLVHAGNYEEALKWFKIHAPKGGEIGLDVEGSTPQESDDWLASLKGDDDDITGKVDTFGSFLTSLQVTFGRNMEYTYYLAIKNVEEDDVKNLTIAQVRDLLDTVPREMHTIVHHAAYELPVCFNAWGKDWESDPEYHGFLRNVIDSMLMSSYADENRRKGLKSLSKEILGYDQTSFEALTIRDVKQSEWNGLGRVIRSWNEQIAKPTGRFVTVDLTNEHGEIIGQSQQEVVEYEDGPLWLKVQLKTDQLTAREVLDYGADDPICTVALANHFRVIMELEGTWDTFLEVEQFPAYLTAKAFIDGVDFSLEEMAAMEKEDDATYDRAWAVLRDYLIKIGFEGTVTPVFEEIDAKAIKQAYSIVTGGEFKTQVRTPSKLAILLRNMAEDQDEDLQAKTLLLAACIESNNVTGFNELVARHYDGEPKLNLGSPTQMATLLYDFMKLPVNIVNSCTQNEREKKPDLYDAIARFKKKRAGKDIELSDKELALVRLKAKTDDTAIDYALAFDTAYIDEESRAALKAIGEVKKVMTRRSLFYTKYWRIKHWKDGKIHAHAHQCQAVTRRYSYSAPNFQQLPKKGEGVKFRGNFKPHHKDAVICSADYTGQELRLAAERSQDRNMLACYIGDKLKDIHSITAAGAMKLKWGAAAVSSAFAKWGPELQDTPEGQYDLFLRLRGLGKKDPMGKQADDLRKDSKNVNFAAQFGGTAPKLAETLIMRLEDAQLFLDAREKMFPDVIRAAERAEESCKKLGYSLTLMGARRHLRDSITSDDRQVASRAARQAWNFEIQGSAAEMTKLGMSRFWKSGALWKYDARFIGVVHDELVTSVHKDHAVEFIKIKHDCMVEKYSTMQVPILASISVGPDFGMQIECGDWWKPEEIRAALDEIFHGKEMAAA